MTFTDSDYAQPETQRLVDVFLANPNVELIY